MPVTVDVYGPRRSGMEHAPALRPLSVGRAEQVARWSVAIAVALLPLLRPAGPSNLAPVDLVIGVAMVATFAWAVATAQSVRAPYALSVAVLMAGGALGAMVGPLPGVGLVTLIQDLWLLVWALVIANLARSAETLRSILLGWCWGAFAWAIVLLVAVAIGNETLSGITARQGGRTALTLGDPNYAANYFVLSLMIMWAAGRPRSRLVRWVAYGTLLAAIAFTGSNSGVVALMVALVVASVFTVGRRLGAIPMVAASCLVVLVSFAMLSSIHLGDIQRAAQASQHRLLRDWVGRSASSIDDREALLDASLQLFVDGGILGQGPASTKSRLIAAQAPYAKEAHDDYLAALTERGLLGVAGLALLVASILVRTSTIAAWPLAKRFAAEVPRTAPLMGAVAGTLVSGTVYELFHVRHVWALVGLIAALELWGRE